MRVEDGAKDLTLTAVPSLSKKRLKTPNPSRNRSHRTNHSYEASSLSREVDRGVYRRHTETFQQGRHDEYGKWLLRHQATVPYSIYGVAKRRRRGGVIIHRMEQNEPT